MDIVSIAPATKTVALGRAAVEVQALSLRKLTRLIVEFPDLLAFAGGGNIDVAALVWKAPDMANAIFMVGLVGPAKPRWWQRWRPVGEDDLLRAFDGAGLGQQFDILSDIVEMTFRGQRGAPFLKSVLAGLASAKQGRPPSAETPTTSAASTPTSSSD